jgi:hypothetical protein
LSLLRRLLHRLRPRRDPLRELLEERLGKLREQAAREPWKVGSLDVVVLWIALKANEESRWIPRGLVLSGTVTLVLMIVLFGLQRIDGRVELTGTASGFSFELAERQRAPLLPTIQLAALTATGLDRLELDAHREIAAPYVVAQRGSEPHLVSSLNGMDGSRVTYGVGAGLLKLSVERAEPFTFSVTDASEVAADGEAIARPQLVLGDRLEPTLIELFPSVADELGLELELLSGSRTEVELARRVPVRSLRFTETAVDHENPEWSRSLGTLHRATLRFPRFPHFASKVAEGAQLELGDIRGEVDYWLTGRAELRFRFRGHIDDARMTEGSEPPESLMPTWFEALQSDRRLVLVGTSVLAAISAITTLLQMRKLL